MGEFELIRQYFQPLAAQVGSAQLVLGPGDDCALQRIPPGRDLVFSVDTLVEGVHFPADYPPYNLGWRALAVAVSDLAAMAATPVCFTLALTLPEPEPQWLSDFARGLSSASSEFDIVLAGGDTTRGPLTISIQVHGTVARGRALLRSQAHPGDLICVSGMLGGAAGALDYLNTDCPDKTEAALLQRYHFPRPRLELGQRLAGIASAGIDISDGLLADLQHLLVASEVGARVDAKKVPVQPELSMLAKERALMLALTGGDDYELCFTIAAQEYSGLARSLQAQMTVIGEIQPEPGLDVSGADPNGLPAGFDHFGEVV